MKTINILVIFLLVLLYSCSDSTDFEPGTFPETPVNFESINSEYDDYNSASPYNLYKQFVYLFSSNRETNGNEFDIENFIVEFYYISDPDEVVFNASDQGLAEFDDALDLINTESNEFGPLIMYSNDYLFDFLFFATDSSGNLDIGYIQHYVYDMDWDEPQMLSKINTENNEAYPTFKSDQSEMYFCSDADGVYDIYKVSLSGSIASWLQTEDLPLWISCDILNSTLNDKCPYINGNLMVFTSDRDGGYGGYDLYYSELTANGWSEPVNFGPEINTEYDEYRPITLYVGDYTNDLMFFSSNRPGGLGGFDLYYVGIPKMIFNY